MLPTQSPARHVRATQTIQALHIPEALLKIQTVIAVTGLSASTIRRKVAAGEFPAPVKDGTRCTRWVAVNRPGNCGGWLV